MEQLKLFGEYEVLVEVTNQRGILIEERSKTLIANDSEEAEIAAEDAVLLDLVWEEDENAGSYHYTAVSTKEL